MNKKSAKYDLVVQTLANAEGPRTANELWEELRTEDIGIATIYRALKSGTDSGELQAVELPGGSVRYETVGREHHHHFLCQVCKRAFDIRGCVEGLERVLPKGFAMAGHEILLFGRCAQC